MDNLKVLKEDVATAINPAGAPSSILAANHKDVLTRTVMMAGKYAGHYFEAENVGDGVMSAGKLIWNSFPMNYDGVFEIKLSKFTEDGTDITRYLNNLGAKSLIKFKDFQGQTSVLEYVAHELLNDGSGNDYYQISVKGNGTHPNYQYVGAEKYVTGLEFENPNGGINGMSVNLFWGKQGIYTTSNDTDYNHLVEFQSFIGLDGSLVPHYRTFDQIVDYLGIEVPYFDQISGLEPCFVFERFKGRRIRRKQDNITNNYYRTHQNAQYRIKTPYNDMVNGEMRPAIIPITAQKAIYDIYAENYFTKNNTPRAKGNNTFVTKPSGILSEISEDSTILKANKPVCQKAFQHMRIRIRTTVNNQYVFTEPLVYFKIRCQVNCPGNDTINGSISYQYE